MGLLSERARATQIGIILHHMEQGGILSRAEAKNKIHMNDYKASMKDIFTTCVNVSTLDEAPQAYKPIEEIINNITDTVDIKKS